VGASIFTDFNETKPDLDIECKFYLSADENLSDNDVLITSQTARIGSQIGYFDKALYGMKVKIDMNFPAGKCYLIMSVDPDNKIVEDSDDDNIRVYEIIIGNRKADLSVQSIEIGTSNNPNVLNVKSTVSNPSDSTFSAFTYSIKILDVETNVDVPLSELTFESAQFKKGEFPRVFENSITLPGSLDLSKPFYISVVMKGATPEDTDARNNSKVVQVVLNELKPLVFYETKVLMTNRNDSLYTCSAQIFDNGGEAGNYSPNIRSTIRIFPTEPNSVIKLTVQPNFELWAFDDIIQIINPDNNSIIKELAQIYSSSNPYTFISDSKDGSIILKFITDGSSQNKGFEILATCLDTIEYYKMGYKKSTSVKTCNRKIFDNGYFSDYKEGAKDLLTIYPEEPGQKVIISFSEFEMEKNYDFLSIYNGNSTNESLIDEFTGSTLPGNITSTAADGSLTLLFTSDNRDNESGFIADISCTSIASIDRFFTSDNMEEKFHVSPNPNNGRFRLLLKNETDNYGEGIISIYDSKGMAIYRTEQKLDESIDLNKALQNGIYILKTEDREGNMSLQRFVIE
jgi:hypothetical protein